jgi:hypothetical protein
MADQAESLRRLVQARREWEELTGGPPAPRPARRRAAGGADEARERARDAASRPGIGARRKPGAPRT